MINRILIAGGVGLTAPFFIFPFMGDGTRFPKIVLVIVLALAIGAYHLNKIVNRPVAILFFYLGINAIATGFFHSFQALTLIFVSAAAMSLFLLRDLDAFAFGRVLIAFMWGGVVNAVMALLQVAGYPLFFYYLNPKQMYLPIGFLGQPTLLGAYLAAASVIALFYQRYILLALFLAVIFFINSSFTWLALIAGTLVYLLYTFPLKRVVLIGSGLFALGLGLFLSNPVVRVDHGRFEQWRATWDKFLEYPIMGYGLGTYEVYGPMIQSEASKMQHGLFLQAHNDLLQFLFECGIIGVLLLSWCLWLFTRKFLSYFQVREVALAGAVFLVFAVNSIGNFPFRLVPHGLLALWCLVFVSTFGGGLAYDRSNLYRRTDRD